MGSMLSKEDILKELGHNLYIFPFDKDNLWVHDASIDLTISEYAWSVRKNATAYNKEKNSITIEANDTVFAYSKEAIHITNKLAGIFTSMVSKCVDGLNPISTNLDPNYIGFMLIVLKNTTEKEINIPLGSPFVSLQLFYLHTPVCINESQVIANHETMIRNLFPKDSDLQKFINYCGREKWPKYRRDLIAKYNNSDLKKTIKEYVRDQTKSFSLLYRIKNSRVTRYIVLLLFVALVYVILELVGPIIKVEITEFTKIIFSFLFALIGNDLMKGE